VPGGEGSPDGRHRLGLHPDQPRPGQGRAHRDSDARRKTAAADRHGDRAGLRALLRNLEADGPLAGDDVWMVERVDEDRTVAAASSRARARASSTVVPCRITSAPYDLVAATFGSGAAAGMTTVAAAPSAPAASATPWP
jgi:hypothetical protein